jgi:polar amino acid transport system substrate-binding protein
MGRLRTSAVALAAVAFFAATSLVSLGASADPSSDAPTVTSCHTLVKKLEVTPGKLTIATDNPVYPPWFKNNQPSNKQGYESALAYQVAHTLGVADKNVKWVSEPFASSYAPGTKNFDFDINEVVATPERAQDVSFSSSYFDLSQSLVAMKSDPIVKSHTPAALRKYTYGVLSSTPAESYATLHLKVLKPTQIKSFGELNDMVNALESGVIDAIVIDTPTGNYLVNSLILGADTHPLATQVGQFAAVGDEYYGLVLAKKNPLLSCANVALAAIKHAGELHRLSVTWLSIYNSVALLKP